jgi:ribosome assembly protein 1
LCLRDLRERYAKIAVEASPPIVPFRESISTEPGRNPELRFGEQFTADKSICVTVLAQPLPGNVVQFLDKSRARVDALLASDEFLHDDVLRLGLEREMRAAGSKWLHLLPYLWAIGPTGIGTNMVFNRILDYGDTADWQARKALRFEWSEGVAKVDNKNHKDWRRPIEDEATRRRNAVLAELDGTIRSGFLMASARGPLCEEPMMGVCFVVSDVKVMQQQQQQPAEAPEVAASGSAFGPLSGQMIAAVASACRQAFLSKSARLYEATYVCDVRLTERSLGKVSSVLGRRRAEIFAQEYDLENATITLKALLPVRESFGLYQEMIAESSGAASVQLMLHDWKLLDMDPFFEAKTEAELEDIGHNVGAVGVNLARELLDEARRRKGLQVEEKLVEAGDKQRTLSKKK